MALLFLLPWSAFAFKALASVPHQWRNLNALNHRARALLLWAITIAVVLGFFSFSSRQEYYVLPVLPALALIIGAWLSQEQRSPTASPLRRAGQRIALATFVVAAPLALSAWGLLLFSQRVPPQSELADLLTSNPSEYALSFGHIFDLTPRAMGMFRPQLLLIGIAIFLGTLASWLLRRRNRLGAANLALALMMLVSLQCVHSALVTFAPILSSRALSDVVAKLYSPGDVIVVNGAYEDASTLNFYGRLPLHLLNSRENGDLYVGSLFPDAPAIFEDDASFARLWRGSTRVFVFTQQNQIPPLLQQTGYRTIARSGGKLILQIIHDGWPTSARFWRMWGTRRNLYLIVFFHGPENKKTGWPIQARCWLEWGSQYPAPLRCVVFVLVLVFCNCAQLHLTIFYGIARMTHSPDLATIFALFSTAHILWRALLFVALIGTLSSTVFLALTRAALRNLRLARKQKQAIDLNEYATLPFVTILKPLHGAEPRLEENLESFFLQNYPAFEIIFGCRTAADPALATVERLRKRHPHIAARIVLSGEPQWPSAKVWSLDKMIAASTSPLPRHQ